MIRLGHKPRLYSSSAIHNWRSYALCRKRTPTRSLSSSPPSNQNISRLTTTAPDSSQLPFQVSEEVRDAIYNNKPVVALETTIYTHGFPYPDNVTLALDLEALVRRNGGIPATIGIHEGIARIGLTKEQLTDIASSAGKPETMKVSRRDIPYILGLVSSVLLYKISSKMCTHFLCPMYLDILF